MHLPGREIPWKDFLNDIKQECIKDKIDTVAASLAFFGVLAIFPFLLFAVALAGLVIDPAESAQLMGELYQVAPPAVANILGERLQALTGGQSPALLTVGALGAIWAASGGVTALMDALNSAYGVEDRRSYLKRRGIALLVTLGGAVLLTIASAIAVATPALAAHLGPFATLVLWLRMPVSALIVMVVLAILYYLLPDVEQRFKFITPGSVVAVVIWVLASLGFSFYVSRFGSYEVSYGALGGVIILLLWMWISSLAVLLGAEINAIIEHRSPEGKRTGAKDASDTGADLPKTEKTEKEEAQGAALPAGAARAPRSEGSGSDGARPNPAGSRRSELHRGRA
ncbi:YihY/virulence factor BrkB family protein [Sorangium sp. So ce281]|uniref:YihY/virulence factor BrkB family protein n=1 Tax=unclassified Sorangium TaxID=2621164 RepID=UPI003F64776C